MAESIDYIFKAVDQFSPVVNAMKNASQAFNKSLEGTDKRLKALAEDQNELKKGIGQTAKTAKIASADAEKEIGGVKKAYKDLKAVDKNGLTIPNFIKTGVSGSAAGKIDDLILGTLKDPLLESAGALINSSLGGSRGGFVNSVLSGTIGGAARGAILGHNGALIGAAAGALAGVISDLTKTFKEQDNAFKKYNQELYSTVTKRRAEELERSSELAAEWESAEYPDASDTYRAKVNKLKGIQEGIDISLGQAYNQEKEKGLDAEAEAYHGNLGLGLSEMNTIIGEGRGIAENLEKQYKREAMIALTLGTGEVTVYNEEQKAMLGEIHDEYTDLKNQFGQIDGKSAEDLEQKAVIAAKIENLKSEAESLAESSYNASGISRELKDANLGLIAAIRENTAALGSNAYGAAQEIAQEQDKGLAAGESSRYRKELAKEVTAGYESLAYTYSPDSVSAFGLNYVPRDNFLALLHQGERVLTAGEARAADRGGRSVIVDKLADTLVVREDADIEKIAMALVQRLRRGSTLALPVM